MMDDPTPEILTIPPWLRAMIDQRLSELEDYFGGKAPNVPIVLIPLTEKPEGVDRDYWDRVCDNCGTYVAPNTDMFWVGHVSQEWQGSQVIICYGVCGNCKGEPVDV